MYEELAREDLVLQAGRHGTVVQRNVATGPDLADLDEAAIALALVARQLGVSAKGAHAALDRARAELRDSEPSGHKAP